MALPTANSFFGPKTDGTVADAASRRTVAANALFAARTVDLATLAATVGVVGFVHLIGTVVGIVVVGGIDINDTALGVEDLEVESRPACWTLIGGRTARRWRCSRGWTAVAVGWGYSVVTAGGVLA